MSNIPTPQQPIISQRTKKVVLQERKKRNVALASNSQSTYNNSQNESSSQQYGSSVPSNSSSTSPLTNLSTSAPSSNSSFITSIRKRGSGTEKINGTLYDIDVHSNKQQQQDERDEYDFNYESLLTLEYDPEEFDPFKFIIYLPPKNTLPLENVSRPICLPRKAENAPEITLVLDLDETLVHCSSEPMKNSDFVFPVLFRGILYQVYVRKRPFFEKFLATVSKLFEVVVFTASEKAYADNLLDILDEKKQWVHGRAFRDSCILVEGNYLKDLTVLGRDLSKVVIIDNSPQAYGYQIDNGIPILSWFGDENDVELDRLLPFLKKLSKAKDTREMIAQKFQFRQFLTNYGHRSATSSKK